MDIQNQRKALERKLIEKALKDEAFRTRLSENPKSVIEEEFGIRLPEALQIQICQEDPRTFYLVLPYQNADDQAGDLTEKDLAMVSGAGDGYSINGCDPTYALFCQ